MRPVPRRGRLAAGALLFAALTVPFGCPAPGPAGDAAVDEGASRADDGAGPEAGEVGRDGALVCAAVAEPERLREPFNLCDDRERADCATWMAQFAPGYELRADCVRAVGCVRASECANRDDQASCRCGDGPACERYQVCQVANPGDTPRCTCLAELRAAPDAGN